MTRTILVLSSTEDHALNWARESCGRYADQHVCLAWPFDRLRKILSDTDGFDALVITPDVMDDPRAKTWISLCQQRIRGKDGLTVGQRLAKENP